RAGGVIDVARATMRATYRPPRLGDPRELGSLPRIRYWELPSPRGTADFAGHRPPPFVARSQLAARRPQPAPTGDRRGLGSLPRVRYSELPSPRGTADVAGCGE